MIKTIYIGVPDRISMNDPPNYDELICNLKKLVTKKYNKSYWDLWHDYCGFNDKSMSLSELSKKYGYNSKQAVHWHIVKIRKYLKTKLKELGIEYNES
jgi:hypothetical protein